MTELTYIVGKEKFESYEMAKRRSAEVGLPVAPKYAFVVKKQPANLERLAKIQKYFAKKRAERV